MSMQKVGEMRSRATREPQWSTEEIEAKVQALAPWFHNLELGGVRTAPEHFLGDYPSMKWQRFSHAIPEDLSGKSVLDIGCNAGFYSIEMWRRGAERVVGIDSDPRYLAQAQLAAEVSGAKIELRELSVYDVGMLGERFDFVLFMGVLYHLRHPLLALDLLHEHVAGDRMVFQTMLRGSEEVDALEKDYPFTESEIFDRPAYPKMHFVEHCYSGDPTNWWIPNTACALAMLRSAGFEVIQQAEQEVFVCRRRELLYGPQAVYPRVSEVQR